MNDVLTIVLGGGRGTRLFPLTHLRSKPAVPIGGKYRLIDVPISNCLHAGLKRIYVLTQFNSASLNRHVAQTYRMDLFSGGFVEVLAAEQTPEGEQWFQGTADAVRQAARHFRDVEAEYYLILAGDHIYRMDRAHRDAHRARRGHHDRRAAGVGRRRDADGSVPVRRDWPHHRLRGETSR
jgi:glucose-1-phosphate adenylyltransferase